MSDLANLQNEFAGALLNPSRPVPSVIRGAAGGRAQRRFAVYRNNVAVGLVNALATRFPVTQRLIGEEFFRAMARLYAEREPPHSPIMLLYGASFPAFIDAFEPAAAIPYLGDVARLEMARGHAYHAADAIPLGADAFAALAPERLGEMKVRLHPSVTVLSSAHPVASIWEAHQGAAEPAPLDSWEGEDALVARPHYDVEVRRLPPGVARFLHALHTGETIAAAVERAHEAAADFDPAQALAVLIGAQVAVRIG